MTQHLTATTATQPVGSGLRLTRRGRLVAVVVLVGLLLAAFTLGRGSESQASSSAPKAYSTTTVHQGETLWAVAKRVAPSSDPRAVVQQIRELNHLDSAAVQAGQQLLLPHAA